MRTGAIFVLCALCLMGCGTDPRIPRPIASSSASYDGNAQNSGVICVLDNGFLVTPHFRARYNGLVEVYGKLFKPALLEDEGITSADKDFIIDNEHMIKFITMNQWYKLNRNPNQNP